MKNELYRSYSPDSSNRLFICERIDGAFCLAGEDVEGVDMLSRVMKGFGGRRNYLKASLIIFPHMLERQLHRTFASADIG